MIKETIKIPLYFQKLQIVVQKKLIKDDYESYVLFKKNKMVLHIKPGASPGVVAHEAVHIANYVFSECHITPDLINDEPQAYLIGWIVDRISEVIKKANQ